jgi:hypothetical protein
MSSRQRLEEQTRDHAGADQISFGRRVELKDDIVIGLIVAWFWTNQDIHWWVLPMRLLYQVSFESRNAPTAKDLLPEWKSTAFWRHNDRNRLFLLF